MRRALPRGALLLALAGCVAPPPQPYWARGDGGEHDFNQDAAACQARAFEQAPPVSLGRPGWYPNHNTWCVPTAGGPSCLIINSGYLPQARDAGDTNAVKRDNLFGACMMSAGWRPDGVWEPRGPG